MRLVSKSDAAKLAADPKAEGVKTFYVEKAKGNTIPKHFTSEENKDQKEMIINGAKVMVSRNKERSEYVAFKTGEGETAQAYYIRDHSFLEAGPEFVTYEKPKAPPKPPKEKKAKAEKAEGEATGKAAKGAAKEKAEREARNAAAAGDAGGDTGAA